MTLPTRADLPLRPPISQDLPEPDPTLDRDILLADLKGIGLQHLRGAEAALRAAYGEMPAEIGEVLPVEDGLAARMTDDQWMLITPDRADAPGLAHTSALVTITDVSHGYGLLLLAGPHAPQVLAKICALDFSESAFPDLHAAQTSLANVRALVLRRDHHDRRAYLIAVGRSVTEYVWELLLDAAEEFEPAVVGGASLIRSLVKGTRE